MRIAFVGKGGSGKTTTAAAFSRYLAAQGRPVVAVDADINQHLAVALGHDGPAPRPLGAELPWLKDHLRGANPRIPSAAAMIKTTPPGRGSRLIDLDPAGELLQPVRRDDPRGRAAPRHGRVRRGRHRRLLLPLQDRRGGAVAQPPRRRPGRVRRRRHDRGRRRLRVRPVHPLRPDGAGQRADPARRRGVPAVRGARGRPRRRAAGAGQQGRRRRRPRLPAGRGRRRAARVPDPVPVGARGRARCGRAGHPARAGEPRRARVGAGRARRPRARLGRLPPATVAFHLRNAAAWGDRATGADLAAQVDPEFVPGPLVRS